MPYLASKLLFVRPSNVLYDPFLLAEGKIGGNPSEKFLLGKFFGGLVVSKHSLQANQSLTVAMFRSTKSKTTKMSNSRRGSTLGGFRLSWLVPQNFNNKSPKYVMKFRAGVKPQARVQCRFWATGTCLNPNCKFFHGPVEDKECPYSDTLVNCGVYAVNVPPTISVHELIALANKEGGKLYLNDPKTGSMGVKILKSKKDDGMCAAFIHFTRAKAGKAFVDFLNKNPLKGSVIRAKINSIDEIGSLQSPQYKPKPASPIQDTPSQQVPRVKREQVVDEYGYSVAGRDGKAISRAVPESPAIPESRPQTPALSLAGGDLVSFEELVEAKQEELSGIGASVPNSDANRLLDEGPSSAVPTAPPRVKKEEELAPLPTNSGTWYNKQKLDYGNHAENHTGKKKKGKRSAPSPMETKKLFEGETEKRRAKDGNWYTKQQFYDYYAMVEGVDYAYEQWQTAVRGTKVNPGLTWLGALRPDIVQMQNAEIEAWGEELAAQYDDEAKTKSPVQQPLPAAKPTLGAFKPTPGASTSADNAPIDSTTYDGFVQQFEVDVEVDEYDGDDLADDEVFSSYVAMMKRR